ncbi:Chaperone protein DnaJ [Halorhabdus tiamatea SARL4B]|uniref:Chaperone protein DnaJ n=1 Tax=Halorhabdus tiamatea SARL4B TaxID=1033806 RepID=F7PN55_9EURY|nr:molecular chaperone DnaJ [Halorhabdus tiamatea]ERJ07725.1 Chaperone protein DnaJ [Halorhabdus tiamatea SARL4B]CCQ32618.1 chaperone protein DnaJ [Halorhabdus tiamatea SARL4B]
MSEDFYDVLGVSRDASEEEIQEAYREKARQYHPDVSDDPDAEEKFKQAKKAKEVLTDDEKRQAYDRMGHERFEQAEKRGGFDDRGGRGGAGGRRAGGDPFGGGGFGSVEDIFDQFFGGGGGGRRRDRPRQGQDLKTRLSIDLEEAYDGVEKQFTVTRPESCPDCDGEGHPPDADSRTCPECEGRGQVTRVQRTPMGRVQQTTTCSRCEGEGTLYEETCSTCGGDGVVRNEATLSVDVPAGIRDGQTLRMEREGAPGENGGPNGDLLIEVEIEDHDDFARDGDDLRYTAPITFPQAALGDTIEIPTFDGAVEFDVPAGTQSGETFRLESKGMPRLRRRGQGDLLVTVQVYTPESLNEDQREALEDFAEASGEEIDVEQGFFDRLKRSL